MAQPVSGIATWTPKDVIMGDAGVQHTMTGVLRDGDWNMVECMAKGGCKPVVKTLGPVGPPGVPGAYGWNAQLGLTYSRGEDALLMPVIPHHQNTDLVGTILASPVYLALAGSIIMALMFGWFRMTAQWGVEDFAPAINTIEEEPEFEYCSYCRSRIADDADSCHHCGAAV